MRLLTPHRHHHNYGGPTPSLVSFPPQPLINPKEQDLQEVEKLNRARHTDGGFIRLNLDPCSTEYINLKRRDAYTGKIWRQVYDDAQYLIHEEGSGDRRRLEVCQTRQSRSVSVVLYHLSLVLKRLCAQIHTSALSYIPIFNLFKVTRPGMTLALGA